MKVVVNEKDVENYEWTKRQYLERGAVVVWEMETKTGKRLCVEVKSYEDIL